MSKVGLIVVDVQSAFSQIEPLKESLNMAVMFGICPALEVFRKTQNPIFFVQHVGDFTPEGSPGFDLLPALARRETEYQVVKRRPNSFLQTDLNEKLKSEGVEFLVVCGLAAGYCVNATMQGATEHGFKAAILQHGIVSHKESHVQVAYETHPVISVETLKYFLAGA